MFFPEYLYQLSSRDQQVTWLDPLLTSGSTVGAGQAIHTIAVPNNRVLVLQHALLQATPAALEFVGLMQLSLLPPAGGFEMLLKGQDVNLAADVAGFLDWQGSLVLPPSWRIRALANYSGGGGSNTALNIGGILIPPGNLQRV